MPCRYRGRGAACVQNNQHLALASRAPDYRASVRQAYLHNCLFIVFWQLIKCKAAGSNFPFLPVNVSITDQNSSSAQYFAKLKMSLVEQNSNKQVTSRLGLKVWEKEKHINLSLPHPAHHPHPALDSFLPMQGCAANPLTLFQNIINKNWICCWEINYTNVNFLPKTNRWPETVIGILIQNVIRSYECKIKMPAD